MGALPENLLVMITDPSTRKSIDPTNVLHTCSYSRCEIDPKLRALDGQLIEDCDFVDLREADRSEAWDSVPVIALPERRKQERTIPCCREK